MRGRGIGTAIVLTALHHARSSLAINGQHLPQRQKHLTCINVSALNYTTIPITCMPSGRVLGTIYTLPHGIYSLLPRLIVYFLYH